MMSKERFLSKVQVDEAGCWLWMGAVSAKGYGWATVDGRPRRAHRVAYELFVGSIPEGLQLDHLCRVRHCVNPAHLEPVTSRENTRRGLLAMPEDGYCIRGHPLEGENLYIRPSRPNVRGCRICRREHSRERKRRLRASGVARRDRDTRQA